MDNRPFISAPKGPYKDSGPNVLAPSGPSLHKAFAAAANTVSGPLRGLGVNRVSDPKQAEPDKHSLELQKKRTHENAVEVSMREQRPLDYRALTATASASDSESAYYVALERAVDEWNPTDIFFPLVDRGFRNVGKFYDLMERYSQRSIRIWFDKTLYQPNDPMSRAIYQVMVVFAELWAGRLGQATNAKHESARLGRYYRKRVPTGYTRQERGHLVFNEDAPTVRQLFEDVASMGPTIALSQPAARKLGITTVRGIVEIVQDRIYAGNNRYGDTDYYVEAYELVDGHLWAQANARLPEREHSRATEGLAEVATKFGVVELVESLLRSTLLNCRTCYEEAQSIVRLNRAGVHKFRDTVIPYLECERRHSVPSLTEAALRELRPLRVCWGCGAFHQSNFKVLQRAGTFEVTCKVCGAMAWSPTFPFGKGLPKASVLQGAKDRTLDSFP